ncbi:MAG: FecR family protein [Sphingobacterium hotanense]
MTEQELNILLDKYYQSACNQAELAKLEAWYLSIGESETGAVPKEEQVQRILQAIWIQIDQQESGRNHRPIKRFPKWGWWAAASLFLFLGAAESYTIYQKYGRQEQTSPLVAHDIAAGTSGAILIHADGASEDLNRTVEGEIIDEGAAGRIRYEDGGLVFSGPQGKLSADMAFRYQEVRTNYANEYKVTLPDGTKVYLNAGSSIRFPVQFAKDERRISVSGEVFLDVSKMHFDGIHVPFIVRTDQQEIEVLGTEFNVQAYPDAEKHYVSLMEGKVLVKDLETGEALTLKPGQSVVAADGLRWDSRTAEERSAWHRGDFVFEQESLGNILTQLSRWYNVEIDCPQELKGLQFSGTVSRKQPISAIVYMLNSTRKVKVNLLERRLVVR